jgi:glycosyltransferase involved in cell wall biosynthesis
MKILIATDAWDPQVNGVVRTLKQTAREAALLGSTVEFLTPNSFRTIPMPGYSEIRLSLTGPRGIARKIEEIAPQVIHIATEGPIGYGVRKYCLRRGLTFTTSLHTRFPDYLAHRFSVPGTAAVTWGLLRKFHAPSAAILAATPGLKAELESRGFGNVRLWPRGVDSNLFRPRHGDLGLPRPIFLTVGRVATEKNLPAFLSLDLPGTKVVVGDGPSRDELQRRFPDAVFLGAQHGERLAETYAAADVFVFPSLTDTFGLVLLEALASGVPVAAFPASAPRDVIGDSGVGALNDDLRQACLDALRIDRAACRDFASKLTWHASTQAFLTHVEAANTARHSGRSGARRLRWLQSGESSA